LISPAAARTCRPFDQRRHDVDANEVHAQIRAVDPAGVAAGRVEQRSDGEYFRQAAAIRYAAQRSRPSRSPARKPKPARPINLGVVDAPKALLETQARKGFLVLKEALMREDGRTIGIA